VADHLRLDLNLVELLAGVDTNDAADHLGDNDHVTQVRLDDSGLLVRLGLLLGLAKLLNQTHWLALQTAVEAAAGAGVHDITQLLRGEVEEPVENKLPSGFPFMAKGFSLAERVIGDDIGLARTKMETRSNILVEVNSTVGKLLELPLLLQFCCWRHLRQHDRF